MAAGGCVDVGQSDDCTVMVGSTVGRGFYSWYAAKAGGGGLLTVMIDGIGG